MIYLGYYDTPDNRSENRNYVLAATNKMTYIARCLKDINRQTTIVSASETFNFGKFYRGKDIQLEEGVWLKLFPSLQSSFRLFRVLLRMLFQLWLLIWLVTHVRRGEPILVYHSLGYIRLVKWLKRLTGCKLILEVEEIYADVLVNPRIKKKELAFFQFADAYLFPTELLDQCINTQRKPSVIIYGTYQVEEIREPRTPKDKIHVVYAGTFDPRKGGGLAAAAAAAHLDARFHIHILGFGSSSDIMNMKDHIAKIAQETECTLTYDGLLSGEDYIRFLQRCDIGLSTQMPDAAFNNTSFPSKILTYLANGLKVVSIRIPVVEQSAISNSVVYYDKADPKLIALAIRTAASSPCSVTKQRNLLKGLDEKFRQNIKPFFYI